MSAIGKFALHVLPICACMLVGYFGRKRFGWSTKYVTNPLIYVLIPVLVFDNISGADITGIVVIPAVFFLLASLMNLPARLAHRQFIPEFNPYLLGCAFAFFNIAFFGIPVAKALFGDDKTSLIISAYLGSALYGDTIGYYQVARTKLPARKAATNVFRIPVIYAFVLAVIAKALGWEMPKTVDPVMEVVSWAVSVLGMGVIGMNLVGVDFKKFKYRQFGKALALRIGAAAVFLAGLLALEAWLVKKIAPGDRYILALIPLFPIAATLSVFATFLETEEENAAVLVAFSTVVSLVLVPIAAIFVGK